MSNSIPIKTKSEVPNTEEEEKYKPNSNINLKESSESDSESKKEEKSSDSKSSRNSSSDDCESLSSSIDEERITLGQINKMARRAQKKKEKMDIKSFLKRKRHLESNVITYDEKKGKIENEFCGSIEELNEFLNKCEIKKITFDDFSNNQKDAVTFDPNEWMKTNKIMQRTISLEDLQVFYQKKNAKKKDKEKKEEKEDKKDKIIKKENEKEKKRSSYLNDKKIYEDYVNLKKIIECKKLSIEQKEWISELIARIKKKDIKDINIEKNWEDKFNKLELVFDLDNTCIFSFLSNTDVLQVQKKKNIFPQKEVKMISFKFNNKVIYTALIIRKGLKEFLNYVSPLCNFHISTLGAESYGNEVKDILTEYTGEEFIRFKGRVYSNEFCKNISDLYINSENTVIFDDYIRVWENKNKDNEQVINTKYFFDEECAMLNNIGNNNIINNISGEKKNKDNDAKVTEIELFIKSYRTLCYNKIKDKDDKNLLFNEDWKVQNIIEYQNIPFYLFNSNKDYNNNKCFTAEYLNSPKYQFTYMKDVIKVIYCLKFIFDIDIRTAIKLIKICTLNNMKFDLKYLVYDQNCILADMIRVCGGIIYDKNYNFSNNNKEKIYLVISKRIYDLRKDEVKADLQKNNNKYILINERFILDTYYFMTDIRSHINDPEYVIDIN